MQAHLLTHLGTVLREDPDEAHPAHAAVWPERGGRDYAVDLPRPPIAAPARRDGTPPEWLEPARGGRWVTWRVGDFYRCAEAGQGRVAPTRRAAGPWEHFLPVGPGDLALLRHLLAHSWHHAALGRIVPSMHAGPALSLGAETVAIDTLAIERAPDGVVLWAGETAIHLTGAEKLPHPETIEIRGGGWEKLPAPGAGAALAMAAPARFIIGAGPEFAAQPLTVDRRDRDWLVERRAGLRPPRLGHTEGGLPMIRVQNGIVLTARGLEGIVLDRDGTALTEAGYMLEFPVGEGPVLCRAGNRFHLRAELVADAARLPGTSVVFTPAHCPNYYHFVVEGLVPLLAVADALPREAALLVPETLPGMRGATGVVDHLAALAAWGLDAIPHRMAPGPVVLAEDLIAPAGVEPQDVPASLLRRARAHVVGRNAPVAATPLRRLYLPRRGPRAVRNEEEVATLLRGLGFETAQVDGLSPAAQVALFASAGFVVMPHGAAVTNTLFCPDGARVVELMPDAEYRPMYADLGQKLTHAHAVLPCRTEDGGFNGRMEVDTARLARLIRLIEAFTP